MDHFCKALTTFIVVLARKGYVCQPIQRRYHSPMPRRQWKYWVSRMYFYLCPFPPFYGQWKPIYWNPPQTKHRDDRSHLFLNSCRCLTFRFLPVDCRRSQCSSSGNEISFHFSWAVVLCTKKTGLCLPDSHSQTG